MTCGEMGSCLLPGTWGFSLNGHGSVELFHHVGSSSVDQPSHGTAITNSQSFNALFLTQAGGYLEVRLPFGFAPECSAATLEAPVWASLRCGRAKGGVPEASTYMDKV